MHLQKAAVLAKKNGRLISPRYAPLTIFWFSSKTGGSGSTQQPSFPSLAQPAPDVIGSSSRQSSGHMTEPVYYATHDTDDYRHHFTDPGPNIPRQQLWATSIQHHGTSQLTETTSEIGANQEYGIPALSYQSEEKAVEEEEEEEEEHMRKGELCETDLRRKLMQKHQLMRTAEMGVEYEQQQLQQHEEEEAVDQDKEEEEEEEDEEVLVSERKGMGKGLEVVVGWQGRAVSRKRRVCYYGNK